MLSPFPLITPEFGLIGRGRAVLWLASRDAEVLPFDPRKLFARRLTRLAVGSRPWSRRGRDDNLKELSTHRTETELPWKIA